MARKVFAGSKYEMEWWHLALALLLVAAFTAAAAPDDLGRLWQMIGVAVGA